MTIEFNNVRRTGKFLSDMPLKEEHKLPYDIGVRAALKAAGIDRPDISLSRFTRMYRRGFNLVMRDVNARTEQDADAAEQLFYETLKFVWNDDLHRNEFLLGASYACMVKRAQLDGYEEKWGYHPLVFALQQHIDERVADLTDAYHGRAYPEVSLKRKEADGLIEAAHLADFRNSSHYVMPGSKRLLDEILTAPSTGEYENEFFD